MHLVVYVRISSTVKAEQHSTYVYVVLVLLILHGGIIWLLLPFGRRNNAAMNIHIQKSL